MPKLIPQPLTARPMTYEEYLERAQPVRVHRPPDPMFGLLARQSEPRLLAAVQEYAPSTLTPRPIR